jgi:hypothetical protein
MTVGFYTGFDTERIGSLSITVVEDGATATTFTVTASTGTYCHRDLQSVMGSGDYDDFAGELKSIMDAGSASAGCGWTYNVTWSNTGFSYTVAANTAGAVTFDLLFSGAAALRMRNVLGYSGDQTNAQTYTSDIRPYYVLSTDKGAIGYRSGYQYHDDDWAHEFVAEDGTTYGLAKSTPSKLFDLTVPLETKELLWSDYAATAVPWVWEDLLLHAHCHEPVLIQDDENSTTRVVKIRADSISMRTGFRSAQYVDEMDLPLGVRVLGSI